MGKFFIDDFNIAKDIIYGRGRMINNYLKLLNENDKLKEYDTGFEEYKKNYKGLSNIYFELWLKTNNFFAINTYTEYLNDANYIKSLERNTELDKTAAYTKAFTDTRYHQTFDTMDRAKLIKSNASIVETTDRAILEAAHKDMIIRRGCKFGIAYITENLKGKVYYALDEITSLSVTDKTNFTNDFINEPKLPICTTELRYLFRNWQRYIGKVSFMKIKEIKTVISVYAPWDQPEYIAGWASYALDRIAKTAFEEGPVTLSGNTYKQKLADLTNKIQQKKPALKDGLKLDGISNSINAKQIISIFHSLPYAIINKHENVEPG